MDEGNGRSTENFGALRGLGHYRRNRGPKVVQARGIEVHISDAENGGSQQ